MLENARETARVVFVEMADAARLERAGRRIEVLADGDARVANPDQRRRELRPSPVSSRFEIPVSGGTERAPRFLALDDQPDRDALHAPRAETGLHLLPQHR